MKKIKKLKINWFYVFLGVLFLILLINRSFPYYLYGPFGFGYDTGIYRKEFLEILSFSQVFNSPVDIFPAFLAYLFNLLHLPMNWLLYDLYIVFSAFIAVPLYLLTKEYFGKYVGAVAVVIFTVSYIQVVASEFYLYKTIIGAIFMLYAFYFYAKKSYKFYVFVFLLALTQLPQLLLLVLGVGVAALFGGKKNLKFNLIGLLVLVAAGGLLLIFRSDYMLGALDLAISTLKNVS